VLLESRALVHMRGTDWWSWGNNSVVVDGGRYAVSVADAADGVPGAAVVVGRDADDRGHVQPALVGGRGRRHAEVLQLDSISIMSVRHVVQSAAAVRRHHQTRVRLQRLVVSVVVFRRCLFDDVFRHIASYGTSPVTRMLHSLK